MSGIPDLDVFRCDLDGINLIEASAGTGKTWNICGLYLRLLLERGLDVQQILVVTFTNAATAELRERIRTRIVETRDYLASGIAPGGDPFVPTLVNELAERQKIAEGDMIRRLDHGAANLRRSVDLHHSRLLPARARRQSVRRRPAFWLELVQDDSDLLMESVHDFWRRHIAGDALPAELISFIVGQGDTPETYARLLERHLAKPLAISLWPDGLDSEPAIDSGALRATYADVRRLWADHGVAITDFLISSLGSLNGTTYKETSVREGADAVGRTVPHRRPAGPARQVPSPLSSSSPSMTARRRRQHRRAIRSSTAAESFLYLRETIDEALALRRLRLIRALLDEAGVRLRAAKRAASRRILRRHAVQCLRPPFQRQLPLACRVAEGAFSGSADRRVSGHRPAAVRDLRRDLRHQGHRRCFSSATPSRPSTVFATPICTPICAPGSTQRTSPLWSPTNAQAGNCSRP